MIIRFQRCLAACGRHGGVFDIGKDQKTSYAFPILCIASASDVMGKMTRKPQVLYLHRLPIHIELDYNDCHDFGYDRYMVIF